VSIENADRIIIAPAHDFVVSRTHLYLDVVAKDEFLVENRSQKSSLFLETGEKLPPGQHRYCSTPLAISLGKKTVRLEPS
jgi:hypothetical protein